MKKMTETETRKLIARILTVHGYRNSPIEDIHASGRITDEEMKHLNKTILNQIYTLLMLIENGKLFNSWWFTNDSWWREWDEPKYLKEWEKGLDL